MSSSSTLTGLFSPVPRPFSNLFPKLFELFEVYVLGGSNPAHDGDAYAEMTVLIPEYGRHLKVEYTQYAAYLSEGI